MTAQTLSVLLVDAGKDAGDAESRTALQAALTVAGCTVTLAAEAGAARQHDAVLFEAPTRDALAALSQRADLRQTAFDSAVVVLAGAASEDIEADLLLMGVQAIVLGALPGGLKDAVPAPEPLVRALRHAALRKRVERATHTAYATDLATGLPHQAQLLEHMTQLLALRERTPAPMVLLVLRIDGYAGAAARLGVEAANVLRRKVAVRLRSGLRASDVVAAIGPEAFGVLLPQLEALSDGERVAAKLVTALQQPLVVAGQACSVSAAVGMALYPTHGKDAQTLFKRASAQAGSIATVGTAGYAGATVRGPGEAANDDTP